MLDTKVVDILVKNDVDILVKDVVDILDKSVVNQLDKAVVDLYIRDKGVAVLLDNC